MTRLPAGHVAVMLLAADVLAVFGATRTRPTSAAFASPAANANTATATARTAETDFLRDVRPALIGPLPQF